MINKHILICLAVFFFLSPISCCANLTITVTKGDHTKRIDLKERKDRLLTLGDLERAIRLRFNLKTNFKNNFFLHPSKSDTFYSWTIPNFSLADLGIENGMHLDLKPRGIVLVHYDRTWGYDMRWNIAYNPDQTIAELKESVKKLEPAIEKIAELDASNYVLVMDNGVILDDDTYLSSYPRSLKKGYTIRIYLQPDSIKSVAVTKDDKTVRISITQTETLASLKEKVATAFALEDDQVHKFTLKSQNNTHYENLNSKFLLTGWNSGLHLTMEPRKAIRIEKRDASTDQHDHLGTFYLTYSPQETLGSIVTKMSDTYYPANKNILLINGKRIRQEDYKKTVPQLGITQSCSLEVRYRGHPRRADEWIIDHKKNIIFVFGVVTLAYLTHKFTKTDMFGRFWYDRLGRYKKLTEQRKKEVMIQLANLHTWYQENSNELINNHDDISQSKENEQELAKKESDQEEVTKKQKKIHEEYKVRKERILRPFSPEDREKLEKDFEKEEKNKMENIQKTYKKDEK